MRQPNNNLRRGGGMGWVDDKQEWIDGKLERVGVSLWLVRNKLGRFGNKLGYLGSFGAFRATHGRRLSDLWGNHCLG